MKKQFISFAVTLCLLGIGVPALATQKTVYYHGNAVYWAYGRKNSLWGYSKVYTSLYKHGATVNGTFSGWKKAGKTASVTKYIGTKTLYVYWCCK